MKRRIALGLTLMAAAVVIRQVRHSVEFDAISRYWDEKFSDGNPERAGVDPKIADWIDTYYAYRLEIERRRQETGEYYGM